MTHDPRAMMKAWRLRNHPKKGTTIKTEAQLAVLINGFNYWIHGKKLKRSTSHRLMPRISRF